MPSLGVAPPPGQMTAAGAVLQAASVDPMLLQTAHGTDLITTGLAKFNGSIRYPQYQANLRLLAEKVLTRDNQALLLSILNTSQARMQDPSAAPNVVGITWDKVRFVGQEAVVLLAAAKTSQGVQTQLMDTPILPLYEWIFTLDEYLGSCWAQVNRCIQHIKAVRRQADGVRSNDVKVDQRGFLEPMLMSQGDIEQLAMQIPPPDFCLWDFRNELRNSEARRFVQTQGEGKLDRLAGLGGLIDARQRTMTYVDDAKTYVENMVHRDRERYGMEPAGGTVTMSGQKLFPKTPYQRCIEEAIDLSYEQVNTCRALEQGLFRIHFMMGTKKLHAGSGKKEALDDFLRSSLTFFLAGPDVPSYRELEKKVAVSKECGVTGVDLTGSAYATKGIAKEEVDTLKADPEDGPSQDDCAVGDWCNTFAHDNVVVDLLGVGLLQPKPTNWVAYSSNHIRKQWQKWTLSPNTAWVRRETDALFLPKHGGAIGYFFATTVTNVQYEESTKGLKRSALTAVQTEAAQRQRWSWWRMSYSSGPEATPDAPLLCFPYPYSSLKAGGPAKAADIVSEAYNITFGTTSGIQHKETLLLTKAAASADEFKEAKARTTAVELSPKIIWDRMKETKNHPIRHCATIGEALKDLRLNDWIKEHFLHQLIRIFNEVRNVEMASTQISCPGGTNPFPMMRGPNGELVAVPLQQAVTIDPSSGQMVYDPRVAADMTRCVLPGMQKEPPPVPGVANARLGAEFGQ